MAEAVRDAADEKTTRRLLGMVEVVADQREQITALRAENERLCRAFGEMPYPSDVEIAHRAGLAAVEAALPLAESARADLAAFDARGDYEAPVEALRQLLEVLSTTRDSEEGGQ